MKDDRPLPPVIEPFCVTPVYVDSIAKIDRFGPVSHVTFAVWQGGCHSHTPDRIVAARLIIPTELLTTIGRQIMHPETVPFYTQEEADRPLN